MKDRIQQLKLVMQIMENNLDFRLLIQHSITSKPEIHNYPFNPEKDRWGVLCGSLGNPRETISLIPLEFPKLPETEKWHNPDNLTPEQVGKEYRLITTTELGILNLPFKHGFGRYLRFGNVEHKWEASFNSTFENQTYRVSRENPIIVTYSPDSTKF